MQLLTISSIQLITRLDWISGICKLIYWEVIGDFRAIPNIAPYEMPSGDRYRHDRAVTLQTGQLPQGEYASLKGCTPSSYSIHWLDYRWTMPGRLGTNVIGTAKLLARPAACRRYYCLKKVSSLFSRSMQGKWCGSKRDKLGFFAKKGEL